MYLFLKKFLHTLKTTFGLWAGGKDGWEDEWLGGKKINWEYVWIYSIGMLRASGGRGE